MKTRLTAEEQRKRDIAQIHIAKAQLGMNDDTYRDMLFNVTGVRSSRELSATARLRVLQHLKEKGWKKKLPARAMLGAPKAGKASIQPLISKISALLTEMKLPWSYAHAIAKQMWQRERLEWCKPDELRAIITALTNRMKQQNA
ncbi:MULTISPECIES: gp16 family protein [Nitrosomonas]|uniref:Phage gp16-like protein n=1 Tax=Nitrosomonas communis TaxID=44574 RepID=A0A0F7KDN8_9PROT|nr:MULTISPECIES: regulatory protein GemA [Nitrosomonas]AKH37278.1 hypothetical protein AAW31_04825 [Nitrosomonas communis]TYP84709.1 phage gp16-like protein [Nitrosomonas communis]UVS62486.1 regulatory protein GemA [Nitrosomonas sp. PLL12]